MLWASWVAARGNWRWQAGTAPRLAGSRRRSVAAALHHWLGRRGEAPAPERQLRAKVALAGMGWRVPYLDPIADQVEAGWSQYMSMAASPAPTKLGPSGLNRMPWGRASGGASCARSPG